MSIAVVGTVVLVVVVLLSSATETNPIVKETVTANGLLRLKLVQVPQMNPQKLLKKVVVHGMASIPVVIRVNGVILLRTVVKAPVMVSG